jgi:hypothetical protein
MPDESALTTLLEAHPPAFPEGADVMTVLAGGDLIHYQAGNALADRWTRFVAVMVCVPGEPMLTPIGADELKRRRDRRAPR